MTDGMEMSTGNLYPSPGTAGAGTGAGAINYGESREEIMPYKIHVSSKYLDLTRKKLELTRLPHEVTLPKQREWDDGTPKSVVEPLVDYWLEHYTWRTRELHLNTTFPQHRTSITVPIPASSSPTTPQNLRIHFLHIRSPAPTAIPLLLLPAFPLTNFSLAPLFQSLTHPPAVPASATGAQPEGQQAFHVVVPSLPGLGFSDAFHDNEALLRKTAKMYDTLMLRLGYDAYLASGTGSGKHSPAGMDYWLLTALGEEAGCAGVHAIEPVVEAPRFGKQTGAWVRWHIAKWFGVEAFGYSKQDLAAFRPTSNSKNCAQPRSIASISAAKLGPGKHVFVGATSTMLGLTQPATLAYALCDSPVGLLSYICAGLRTVSPRHTLSEEEVLDVAMLAWLPGPEAGLRFARAAEVEVSSFAAAGDERTRRKSRVAVTVFGAVVSPNSGVEPRTADPVAEDVVEDEREQNGEGEAEIYTPPTWANSRHDVLWAQRVPGPAGLMIWQRADILVKGIRGLASSLRKVDARFRPPSDAVGTTETAALEGVTVHSPREIVGDDMRGGSERLVVEEEGGGEGEGDEDEDEVGMQLDVESPDTVIAVPLGG